MPPLKRTLDEKRAAVDAAGAALRKAEDEAGRSQGALARETQRLDFEISGLEGQLRDTAPPAIGEAIEFFRDKFYALRQPGNFQKRAAEGKFSLIKMRWVPGEKENNSQAITTAMQYCNAAIKELERLKLDADAGPAEIEAIDAALPGIDEFTVYDDPKPFEGVKGKFYTPRVPDKTDRLKKRADQLLYG